MTNDSQNTKNIQVIISLFLLFSLNITPVFPFFFNPITDPNIAHAETTEVEVHDTETEVLQSENNTTTEEGTGESVDETSTKDGEIPLNTVNIESDEPEEILTGDSSGGLDSGSESVPDEITETESESNEIINDGILEVKATTTGSEVVQLEGSAEPNSSSTPNSINNNENNPTSTTSIITGDSIATASIVNVVNSNLTNSEGIILLLNNLFNSIGTIDLRNLPFFLPEIDDEILNDNCHDIFCQGSSVEAYINNENDVTLSNELIVRAQSGGNTLSTDQNGYIATGDAYAVADIVNVANSNLTDSNYALMVINNFGDWYGNFVFPGLEQFYNFFNGSGFGGNVTNTNSAIVSNDVTVHTNTGNNESMGDGSTITSGSTESYLNVINSLNNNLTGGQSLAVVFRIHGDWFGNSFNLPDGLIWDETSSSISLFLDPEKYNNQSDASGTTITNSNNAVVNNNVQVYALTGDNHINAQGEGEIETGNAYAAANIVNVVNTNVLSRNWIYAIVNIFGNWHGNLSFGQPNLWVGGMTEQNSEMLTPGSEIAYHYTIMNNGDAPASNITLDSYFDSPHLKFKNNDGYYDSSLSMNIGRLEPNEVKEISVKAIVSEGSPINHLIKNILGVSSEESDENEEDNQDFISITVNQPRAGSSSSGNNSSSDGSSNTGGNSHTSNRSPKFEITKTHSSNKQVNAPTEIDYKITIYNNSPNNAYNTILKDVLIDKNGSVINREEWSLDKVLPYEEITVEYTVAFNEKTKTGTYNNFAKIFSTTSSNKKSQGYESDIASTTIEFVEGEVLGIATCEQYINGYVMTNADNPTNIVKTLQQFLNTFEDVNIPIDGIFGPTSILAVKNFQKKYADEILNPWGIENPTGNVYYTTTKKMNEIACSDEHKFPLTKSQTKEIDHYKQIKTSPVSNTRVEKTPISILTSAKKQENDAKIKDTPPQITNSIFETGVEQTKKTFWETLINNFRKIF